MLFQRFCVIGRQGEEWKSQMNRMEIASKQRLIGIFNEPFHLGNDGAGRYRKWTKKQGEGALRHE